MKSDKYKFIIIGLILFIFSFIFIVLCNGTYNYKLKLDNIHNIDELDIQVKQKKDIVKIIDSRINNNNLELTLKPLCKGKVYIDINSQDDDYFEIFYVHSFNIITEGHYFGRTNGDIVVPICSLLYIGLLLITIFKKYKYNIEDNETTKSLIDMLPLELEMTELNENEKYVYLDKSLPTNSYNPKHINSGDVMLYGDNCLVIFYRTFNTSYSYTKIGHIDDLPVLQNDVIKVRIEK